MKIKFKKYIKLFILLLCFAIAGCGSTGSMDDGQQSGDSGGNTEPPTPTFNFAGTVFNSNGSPFSGVSVAVFSPGYTATTDTTGQFKLNVSHAKHTVVISRTGYIDTYQLVDTSSGQAVDLSFVTAPSPVAAINILANKGTTTPLVSNIINGNSVSLSIPQQASGTFKIDKQTVTNAYISLINLDLTNPLPVPMPSASTLASEDVIIGGKQTPSVLVSIQPFMLNMDTPATLSFPNPDNLTINRVLRFDPEIHKWFAITDMDGISVKITKGGIYGIYWEEPRTGSVRGTATPGSIVMVGDELVDVGTDGTFYVNEVPVPSNERINVLALGPADPETGVRAVIQAVTPLQPGGQAVVDLVQVDVKSIELSSSAESIVADGVSQVTITAQVKGESGPVSDGTSVVFSTTAGTLSANSAKTVNGIATVKLISSTTSGITATVTASAGGFSSTTSVKFVAVPKSIAISTSQTSVKSDDSDSAIITASVLDSNNAPFVGVTVAFAVTGGQISPATELGEGEVFDPSSITTDNMGKAKIKFSSGSVNRANSIVTITATVGGLDPVSIPIQITGTTITLSSDKTNLDIEGTKKANLTVTIKDASQTGIYNADVELSVDPEGSLSWVPVGQTGMKTDVNGVLVLEISGKKVTEKATLTVKSQGTTGEVIYAVNSASDTFTIISPEEDPFSWPTGKPLEIKVQAPKQNKVRFTTSFGTWQNNQKSIDILVNGNKQAVATITSSFAGVATIQVIDADNPSTSDSTKVAFAAPSASAAKISLQASSTIVAPSIGEVENNVTLKATVKTADDQVVGNAPVLFAIERSTGGGEIIDPVIVYTDNLGVAISTFTSGALSSDSQGVLVSATVIGSSPAIRDDVKIIIGGNAASVLIGRSSEIGSDNNNTAYTLPMSVLVTDANGNPVKGANVSLNSWPYQYATGYRETSDTGSKCPPIYTGIFDNEDSNRNLISDPGEDANGDGELTPPSTAAGSLPSVVQTGDNGVAEFTLTYLKQSASWIKAEIVASTLVSGSETKSTLKFWLPEAEDEGCDLPHSPYNRFEVGQIILQAVPENLTADGVSKSTLTAYVRDAGGNPISSGTVNFEIINNQVGTLSAKSAIVLNGTASVTYTPPNGVPANNRVTIRASAKNSDNVIVSDDAVITLIDVIVGTLTIKTGSDKLTVQGLGGIQEALIKATVTKSDETPVPDGTEVSFTTTAGSISSVTKTVNGVATAILSSSPTAGKATITATAGGVSATAEVEFIPGPPSKVEVKANPATLIAGSTTPSTISATVLDANNNPVADGALVTFSAENGSLNPLTATTVTGVATSAYLAPASPPTSGIDTVTAKVIGVQGQANIAIVGPQIADIELTVSPASIPINGATATVRAKLSLVGGGTVPDGTEVKFSIKENGSNASTTEYGEITPTASTVSAIASAVLTSGEKPGTITVRAESGGIVKEINVEYTPGSVTIDISANSVLGTGNEKEVIIKAILKDENGLEVTDECVTFSLDDQSLGTLTPVSGVAPDCNKATFKAGTKGGTATITATWVKNGVNVTGSGTITILSPPAFIAVADDKDANGNPLYPNPPAINIKGTGGQSTSQVVFDVKDAQGNPVADGYRIDFTIVSGPNGGEELSIPFAVTSTLKDAEGNDKPGRVVTILKSGTKAGPVSIKATYFYNSQVSTTSSQIAIVAGQPVGSAFGIYANFLNVSGLWVSGLEDKITVTAADIWGNAVPNGTVVSFKTYNTGGFFGTQDGQSTPGTATTSGGFAVNSLFSSSAPVPKQGFVYVTAEATGGPMTHITSLAVVQETPFSQILYAGTDGGGVYKSNDSGNTWENISRSSMEQRYAQNRINPYIEGRSAISVDPDDHNIVYVGTGVGGEGSLFRSVDGGMNWNSGHSEEWNGIFSTGAAILAVLADGGSNYLWVGTGGNGIYYTTDANDLINHPFIPAAGLAHGKSVWDIIKVNGSGATAILYAASEIGVYKSTDGGANWSATAAASFVGDSIKVLKAHPSSTGGSNDILYVGTEDSGVWVSTDSGNTWANYKSGLGRGLSATTPKPDIKNTGTGIMSKVTVLPSCKSETWFVIYNDNGTGGNDSDDFFTVTGTTSGPQANYSLAAIRGGSKYSIPTVLEFKIEEGAIKFANGDKFTFTTTRDNGRNIKDILVDPVHNKIYAITYYENSQDAHPVGNLYVHELDNDGDMASGDWKEANTGLPEFDPPDDTTLFPQYVLASDSPTNPRALFVGGAGINFYKASTGLDTGTPGWIQSKTGLTNIIMARMPILFSGSVAMAVSADKSTAGVISDLEAGGTGAVVVVTYTIYIQDVNGNPPVTGSKLTVTQGSTVIFTHEYPDTYVSDGTFRDPSDPTTNRPFILTVPVSRYNKVTFSFTPYCKDNAPGCSGSEQVLTYQY